MSEEQEPPPQQQEQPSSGLPDKGWFVDPERPGMLRWWDGERWTAHRVVDPDAAERPPSRPWRPERGRPESTSGWAVASIVLGVFALTPAAIVCGVVAKRRIAASNGKVGGDAMATAGIVLGIVYSVVLVGLAVEALIPQDNAPDFKGPQKPVAALVDDVGRAIAKDEGSRACTTLFTPVFARRVARGSGQSCESFVSDTVAEGDFEARLDVKSIEITGDTAHVNVSEGTDKQIWALELVRGQWRVDDISA